MQLSNDITWNKIKLIEQELSKSVPTVLDQIFPPYPDDYDYEFYNKLAKREIWELANKLYDIATDGLEDPNEIHNYSTTSIH